MTSRGAVLAAVVLVALSACRGQRTPVRKADAAKRLPVSPEIEKLRHGATPTELKPYLDAFPLGDMATRADLLATTPQRSMHLVQTRRGIARHFHPTRTETVYVLRGAGTCFVGDHSYPVTPGATFKIAPKVVHSVAAAEGETIVAVVYFEPPLVGADDRVLVE